MEEQRRRREQQQQQAIQLQQERHRHSLLSLFWGVDQDEDAALEAPSIAHAFYPEGPVSDVIYPVNGGLEDWAYSAAFQSSPLPISACKASPKTPRMHAHAHAMAHAQAKAHVARMHTPWWQQWLPAAIAAKQQDLLEEHPQTPQEEDKEKDKDDKDDKDKDKDKAVTRDYSAVRCAIFLVETHDDKHPKPEEYGAHQCTNACMHACTNNKHLGVFTLPH